MRRKAFLTAGALLLAAGCGSRSGGSSAALSVAGITSAPPRGVAVTSSSQAVSPVATARVALTPRGLSVAGVVRPLLGGEIQYFRVRDPQWDATRTKQLWEEALDQAQAAGCNLISTYVPWDFHEETPGTFDFAGPRDLEHFLEACWKRGLIVHLKPGPFINAEWPNGLGSYGAIPRWWKEQNPGSLARRPDGKPLSFDLLGRAVGRQPSYFAPEHRQAATRWFARLAPLVRRYLHDRPTIAMLQIDNETNYYFKSRFESDYSVHGLAQFRAWLARKYVTVAALNAAYGTSHATFADVPAPSKKASQPAGNLAVQDWFDAGKEGIAEYQTFLRGEWEKLGVREPDVLFTTNDSPHAMPNAPDLVLWDGTTKNRAGLASLDAYPKQFPWSFDRPMDYPFLTSFFTKRFVESNQDYAFAATPQKIRGGFAAELEGGLFNLPLGIKLPVPPAATDHVLLEFFGHGGVVGTIYTFRGGLNRDGSSYFDMAPVAPDGRPTPRYDLVRRFGRGLIGKHGTALLASDEVEAPVALVVGARFDAPAAGVAGHPGWIQAKEAPAVFGWLEDAGLSPAVLDGGRLRKGDLDRFKLVVYVNPDAAGDELARTLDGYVRQGGTLLNLLHAGRHDGEWRAGGVAGNLLAQGLFSDGRLAGEYEEKLGFLVPPHVNLAPASGPTGALATSPFIGQYDVSGAAPFAWDRTAPFGWNGRVTGWQSGRGKGQVLFLGTNPARAFRDAGYYDASAAELATARSLARWVARQAGVQPVLEVDGARARAFARRVEPAAGGGALAFVAGRLDTAGAATVRFLDLASLGLDAATTYRVEDVLSGQSLGQATGADLAGNGAAIPLAAYGTAVLRIAR